MQHSFWHFFLLNSLGPPFFLSTLPSILLLSDTSVLEASGLSLELSSIFILLSFLIWCHNLESDKFVYISWLNLCIQHCSWCVQCLWSPLAQPQCVQVKVVMLLQECSFSCQYHVQSHFHLLACLWENGIQNMSPFNFCSFWQPTVSNVMCIYYQENISQIYSLLWITSAKNLSNPHTFSPHMVSWIFSCPS